MEWYIWTIIIVVTALLFFFIGVTYRKKVAEREIRENRDWLTQLLGVAPRAFAYPCGGYTEQVVEAIGRAGYSLAATMHKKLRPLATAPLLIGRRIVPRGLRPWQAYLLVTRGRFYP